MSQDCQFFEIPETHTLTVRTFTGAQNLPQVIGQSYGAIMQYLAELKETVAGEPFVIYYNLDMENLDVEMGFSVAREIPPRGEIKPSGLPVGPAVRTTFTGPYEKMAPAYDELGKFVTDNGREPTGLAIEYYLTGPETPPDQQVTRIVFPIKI